MTYVEGKPPRARALCQLGTNFIVSLLKWVQVFVVENFIEKSIAYEEHLPQNALIAWEAYLDAVRLDHWKLNLHFLITDTVTMNSRIRIKLDSYKSLKTGKEGLFCLMYSFKHFKRFTFKIFSSSFYWWQNRHREGKGVVYIHRARFQIGQSAAESWTFYTTSFQGTAFTSPSLQWLTTVTNQNI